MELSPDSNPDTAETTRPSRRKSGRAVHAPERLVTSSAPKRKRDEVDDEEAEEDEEDSSEDVDDADDEPDAEEVRDKKRKAKRTTSAKAAAPKRVKTKNATTKLATRPKARAKTVRKGATIGSAEDVGGLYGEVFGEGKRLDDVTAQWLARFDAHQSNALTEIVNLILRATGSEREVEAADIEDVDHAPDRLTEIEEELKAAKVTDYPLIAKNKSAAVFKRTLMSFFNSLVRSIAATSTLFTESELIENIHSWVSAMSSASTRPFRHTATVVSLSILSALAEVGKGLVENRASTLRQVEGEQKKQKKNQARIKDLQATAQKYADTEVQLKSIISDWFDTIFIHRYRDVDPKVRTDCVSHLGEWIRIYPDHFFDGNHLRYMGWVLSDTSAPTRHEVVKQLHRIYKDESKVPGLRLFTERFRPRIVEMAARDAESSVRVAALELLELLRSAGLLEPDDIDTVSKLIYDADPRIRKAVVPFFVAGVGESYESKIDELGGQQALDEVGIPTEDDDLEKPTLQWLTLKSLAELLQSLDPEDELPATIERGAGGENDILVAAGVDSRCTLAAQAIFTSMDDLARWEVVAGCLLFDHSAPYEATLDIEAQFRQQCQLTDSEEVVLLDVLNTSVKSALTDMAETTAEVAGTSKKTNKKLSKAQQQEQLEDREAAAQKLAQIIPRLLKKYGASADAASAVLRLEHVLNLDVFQELRQDSTTYSALLDDINKQFLTHENRQVLFEASDALRHAKTFEELGEITEGHLQTLWEDTTHALISLCRGEDVDARGSIDPNVLKKLESTVLRISNLARISDCTQILETPKTTASSKQRRKQQSDPGTVPLDLLIDLVARGELGKTSGSSQSQSQRNRALDATEDAVVEHAAQSVMFYFMWRVSQLHSASSSSGSTTTLPALEWSKLTSLASRHATFVTNLEATLSSRHGTDNLRIAAAGTLLDLHNMFATLRNVQLLPPSTTNDDMNIDDNASVSLVHLTTPITASLQKPITRAFSALERAFAKAGHHALEPFVGGQDDPDDYYSDEPEEDEDEEAEEDDDPADGAEQDEDEVERRKQARLTRKARAALLVEEQLCTLTSKIVIALRAGVLDVDSGADALDADLDIDGEPAAEKNKEDGRMYKRITRNRARLGANYKEIIAALEAEDLADVRPAAGGSAKARAAKAAKARKQKEKAQTAAARGAEGDVITVKRGNVKSKTAARGKKSKEVVSESEEDEEEGEEEEVQEDEEEEAREEEVADADADADEEMRDVNGHDNDDVESVLGD